MVKDVSNHIVVIGSGAAGLSAAWLLSKEQRVTLLEKEPRLGGHAHTATVMPDTDTILNPSPSDRTNQVSINPRSSCSEIKIDTGFIVYNEPSYPNLTRWFDAMDVTTEESDMSFAVSRGDGAFEYAGGPLFGLIAQPTLPLTRRFWRMVGDLVRFYRNAVTQIGDDQSISLGEFLTQHGYSAEFVQDHLLPFGAAIWSTPRHKMLDYPAMSFIRFCENHGLLKLTGRPQWRTVSNGSERYVDAVRNAIGDESIITGFDAASVSREAGKVIISDMDGHTIRADHVVLATHADQALRLLRSPSSAEKKLLSQFGYESNRAYLHTDSNCMPKRRRAWCSWNYVERDDDDVSQVQVSYWMNRLQNLPSTTDYFVTLNPESRPPDRYLLRESVYEHPVFNHATLSAQHQLWSLQGRQNTWFCGSYFGAGFHEDAVQSGFAVAEQLGGRSRPWKLPNPSTRIILHSPDKLIQSGPTGATV